MVLRIRKKYAKHLTLCHIYIYIYFFIFSIGIWTIYITPFLHMHCSIINFFFFFCRGQSISGFTDSKWYSVACTPTFLTRSDCTLFLPWMRTSMGTLQKFQLESILNWLSKLYFSNTPWFQRNADMWKISMKVRGRKEIKPVSPKLMYVLNILWVTAHGIVFFPP